MISTLFTIHYPIFITLLVLPLNGGFMSKKIIAVMGATGQIGHVIVEDLLKRGHVIRAIGRNERKMRNLLAKGCEVYLYEFDDVEGLTEAFRDCNSVFCMIPPVKMIPSLKAESEEIFQDRVGIAVYEALRRTRVPRVVNLSSLGAELSEGTGPIKGLHKQEERLNDLQTITDLIHLRAGYFMENFAMAAPSILYNDLITMPINGDIPIEMIATRDIGWKVADLLERTDPFHHQIFDFVGPRALSYHEATAILAQILDKPHLHYVQNTFEEERDLLLKAGFESESIASLLEMFQAINLGKLRPNQKLTLEHRGTTTFEEFAQMFVHRMFTAAAHR